MAVVDIGSGLELRIDHRGRSRLFFHDAAIPAQMGCDLHLPLREGGVLTLTIHMAGVKVVHLPKPEHEEEAA